jgi:hypothetical protein
MHAKEPDWEQRITVQPELSDFKWDRWTGWKKGDKRWDVKIINNSFLEDEDTLSILLEWIKQRKNEENFLTVESKWWENE